MTAAPKLFGTDGVRGVANLEPMSVETAVRLGRAAGWLCRRSGPERRRIVIGKDTRWSGDMFEAALASGVCAAGVDAVLAGILPTPAIAFLTGNTGAAAGAVVSASHNPFQDNGIKFFAATGFKFPNAVEEEIERWVLSGNAGGAQATGDAIGRVSSFEDAAMRYKESLKARFSVHSPLAGMKVVVDCAHGAAYCVGPEVLRELGAGVVAMGVCPDGTNINRECGAVHPEGLQQAVRAERAQLGVALDGDADRAIFVDETGAVVDGDEVLAMAAAEMLERGTLKRATVVATIMSNIGLDVALRERGAHLVRVQVGDRYVVEEMLRGGYNLGGEQSGHLVFLDRGTTGDGLVAALAVAAMMLQRGRPLSELKRVMTKFPQVLLSVPVARRAELEGVTKVRQMIDRVRAELRDRGRVVVRYSGTEPLVRVMVEGEDPSRVRSYAEDIVAAIRAELGK
jgi:phosphoglucosamine mutase